ncbi:hypothetical protein FRC07_005044 [Ceratobasidium sp. 392]|nr:hypothetical protein FRC07_005044 [Ceratobasidium sp. 392]
MKKLGALCRRLTKAPGRLDPPPDNISTPDSQRALRSRFFTKLSRSFLAPFRASKRPLIPGTSAQYTTTFVNTTGQVGSVPPADVDFPGPPVDGDRCLNIQPQLVEERSPPMGMLIHPTNSIVSATLFAAIPPSHSNRHATIGFAERPPTVPFMDSNESQLEQSALIDGGTEYANCSTSFSDAQPPRGYVSSDSIQSTPGQAPNVHTRVEQAGVISKDYAFGSPPTPNTPPTRASLTHSLVGSPSVSSLANYLEGGGVSQIPPKVAFASLPRCESPSPTLGSLRPRLRQAASSLRESIVPMPECEACFINFSALEDILLPPAASLSTLADSDSQQVSQAEQKPSRKALIIGSSYDKSERRTATMFSITSLDAAVDDKEDLKEALRQRGYSVHSLVNNQFTRDDVLDKIASFLADAESGDVRAVVFLGHAIRADDQVMLIPPQCLVNKEAISEQDWEENIRKHSKHGVVVFSILVHCLGDFMTQELDLQEDVIRQDQADSNEAGPVFITFSAASNGTAAFESIITANSPR